MQEFVEMNKQEFKASWLPTWLHTFWAHGSMVPKPVAETTAGRHQMGEIEGVIVLVISCHIHVIVHD